MKRILTFLLAAALLLTGCTQEELPLPGADNAAPLAITITARCPPAQRLNHQTG